MRSFPRRKKCRSVRNNRAINRTRLGVELLEDRRVLAPMIAVPDVMLKGDTPAIFSTGWLDSEYVDFDIIYSDESSSSIGTDYTDYNGIAEVTKYLGVSTPLGTATIIATGEFGGEATAQVEIVSSHSGTFSDLGVIGPDVLIIDQWQGVYTEGWWPGEEVTYEITWPDESVDIETEPSADDNGLSYEMFDVPDGLSEGTATLVATGEDSEFVLNYEFDVQTLPGSGPPTLVSPNHVMPGQSYEVTGTRFEEYQVFFYVVQDQVEYDDPGYAYSDDHGRISESVTFDSDLVVGQTATLEARAGDEETVLATYTVNVVSFVPTVTPPAQGMTIQEGDDFTFSITDGIPLTSVDLALIGDSGQVLWEFQPRELDEYGEGTLVYQMPGNVVDLEVDGRTLRLSHAGFTEDYVVPVREGLRVSFDDNPHMEGTTISPDVRNGIGESQIIWQLVNQDNGNVEHEWGYETTDGSGVWGDTESLELPQVLPIDAPQDVYTLRMIHGGAVIDTDVLISEGLRVVLGVENVREGHVLQGLEVRNGPANTELTFEWWHDDTYTGESFNRTTDGTGYGDFSETVPDFSFGGDSDAFNIRVTIDSNDFQLPITIWAGITPDPGDPQQDSSVSTTANGLNSLDEDSILAVAAAIVNGDTLPSAVIDELLENETALRHVEAAVYAHRSGIPIWNSFLNWLVPVANASGATPSHVRDPRILLGISPPEILVVVVYGANAIPDLTASYENQSGMDRLVNSLLVDGIDVLYFRSGNDPQYINEPYYLSPSAALSNAQSSIASYISAYGVDEVIMAGYSWGGGMVQELAGWLDSTYSGNVALTGAAYIDAVDHGGSNQENAFPTNAASVLNIYQEATDEPLGLDGGALNSDGGLDEYEFGGPELGTFHEIFADDDNDERYDHFDIDEAYASFVEEWIEELVDARLQYSLYQA